MRRALVLGGAANVWADVAESESVLGDEWWDITIAINDVGVHWPHRLDYWITLHPTKLADTDPEHPDGLSWEEQRRANGHPDGWTTVSNSRPELVHEVILHWGGGSSAFYAVAVGRELGVTHGVLCGCPLDTQPAFAETTNTHTVPKHLEQYRRAWTRRLSRGGETEAYIRGAWRSCSGWTRELLGLPDTEWRGT